MAGANSLKANSVLGKETTPVPPLASLESIKECLSGRVTPRGLSGFCALAFLGPSATYLRDFLSPSLGSQPGMNTVALRSGLQLYY